MKDEHVVGANNPADTARNWFTTLDQQRRYRKLFPMGMEHFHRQNAYPPTGLPWVPARGSVRNEDLDRHLDPNEDLWIASRAPLDARGPITHFLILDLDAKGDQDAPFDRLDKITEFFGVEPLVFTSPGGGLHAYWFFDEPIRLVNLTRRGRSHTQGLVPSLLRTALGEEPGQGVVEVFPQAGHIIRWPLGNGQDLVDRASRMVERGLSLESKLDAVERYLESAGRLSYSDLKDLADRRKEEFNFLPTRSKSESSLDTAQIDAASLWESGLTERGSRDRSVWALANALVRTPELLALVDQDPVAALADWMRYKHNGLSDTLALLDPEDSWFDAEAERLIQSARANRSGIGSRLDPTLLTRDEVEWILTTSEAVEVEPTAARFNFERQAYAILRKGKSVARYNGTTPDDDGVYLVEIHSDWWKQIPGLRNSHSRADFQFKLGITDLCHTHAPPSWKGQRARTYAMRLDFGGERLEPGFPTEYLAAAAERMGVDRVILEYEYMMASAFDREELIKRYGRWTAERLHEQFHTAVDTVAELVGWGSDHVHG